MTGFNKANNYDSNEPSKPEFSNKEGVAAWMNKSKNGNAYLRVELPFEMGGLCLFPSTEKLEEVFTQFYEEVNQ